jgi:hypothetical protein
MEMVSLERDVSGVFVARLSSRVQLRHVVRDAKRLHRRHLRWRHRHCRQRLLHRHFDGMRVR